MTSLIRILNHQDIGCSNSVCGGGGETSMAVRLQRTSAVNLHPTSAAGSSTQRLLALPPPEPPRAPTAQGDRCWRERGVAHGDKVEPLRRAHHSGVKLGVEPGCGIYVLPRPRAPNAWRASPFAFAKVRRARSVKHVKSGGMSTSLSICSINFFLLLHGKRVGWGGVPTECCRQLSSL